MSQDIQKLIKKSVDPNFIEEVFDFANKYYGGKKTPWGEEYISHVTGTAGALSQLGVDSKTIASGVLHDVLEVSPIDKYEILKEMRKKFGEDVTTIVERFSEIKKVYFSFTNNRSREFFTKEKVENLRRLFLATARDIRVVLIELASRIDRLSKSKEFPTEKQELYYIETLQVFVPIANRLGLGQIKSTLGDLAFENLSPKEFKKLKDGIKQKFEEREKYLRKFIPRFKKVLKHEKIKVLDINYRAKSYWSAYQKLVKKYNMNIERIHDLVALRIIVPDVASCYKLLGIVHKYYSPISEEINDYIAKPKPNGYKSLHTTVYLDKNTISEIQIRTAQMQKEAEYGVCAHWSYKENIDLQKEKKHLEWTQEIPEFWKTFTIDFFEDQVFVFTPKGDIISLPEGSTSIDFAYSIHSDIGNHTESAKISGKIVSLSQALKNGDLVEITTNKNKKPSQDWLKFVKTGVAKSHIKKAIEIKTPLPIFSIPSFIKRKVFEIKDVIQKKTKRIKKEKPNQIYLAGQKDIMVNMAKCCSPHAGDRSKAYITKYRSAVLHKITCPNLQKFSQKFPERIVDASWR